MCLSLHHLGNKGKQPVTKVWDLGLTTNWRAQPHFYGGTNGTLRGWGQKNMSVARGSETEKAAEVQLSMGNSGLSVGQGLLSLLSSHKQHFRSPGGVQRSFAFCLHADLVLFPVSWDNIESSSISTSIFQLTGGNHFNNFPLLPYCHFHFPGFSALKFFLSFFLYSKILSLEITVLGKYMF